MNFKRKNLILACLLASISPLTYSFALGNIKVKSSLGTPFNADISVSLSNKDEVDQSCFKLIYNPAGDGYSTLSRAILTYTQSSPTKGNLHIVSIESIKDPAVKITVEANCTAIGQFQREFIVLLDPPSFGIPLTIDNAIRANKPLSPAKEKPSKTAKPLGKSNKTSTKKKKAPVQASGEQHVIDNSATVAVEQPISTDTQRSTTSLPQASAQKTSGGFALKLSAPQVDMSLSEKMTDEGRKKLREQQMLMDSDDNLSSFLESRNKLKELEGRITELQAKVSASTASPALQKSDDPSALKLDKNSKDTKVDSASSMERLWYWIAIIILTIAFLTALKRRRKGVVQPIKYEMNEPKTKSGIAKNTTGRVTTTSSTTAPAKPVESPSQHTTTSPKDLYRNVIINQFPELKSAGNTEARTIIGVAWQYFEDKGERSRAIELIEFGLEEHPDVDELWLTQFEFLLRDSRRSAYEQLAKRYRQRFPADQSWIKIQSWIQIQSGGRYLDPENSLYAVEAIADNESKVLSLDFDVNKSPNSKKPDEVNPLVE